MRRLALIVGTFLSFILIINCHDLYAHDVKAGKKLYQQRCAACHGKKGEVSDYGRSLKPFPAKDLRTNILPEREMRLTIKYGLYGRSMPGFANTTVDPQTREIEKKLTDEDVSNVIAYIRTLTYKPDLWHGKALFQKVCSPCHIDPKGRELTHAVDLKKSRLSGEEMAEIIRYGRHNKPMISRRDVLTNVEIADILKYILSIRE